MSKTATRGALAALIAAVALVVVAPIGSAAPDPTADVAGKSKCKKSKKTKKIKVADDFFAPSKTSVKKCTKVKWKWLPENLNPHNVTLTSGPKKVKKKDFKSATGSIGIKFNRTLKKTGKYKFVCTIHRTVMTQTITVKK
jgi:plastocyanin